MQAEAEGSLTVGHFRQFRDPATGTFTYLIACDAGSEAVLVDPVVDHVPLYLGVLKELNLDLAWILETHLHADHISGADTLRERTQARVGAGRLAGIDDADRLFGDGDALRVGDVEIATLATPGHTPGCLTYRWKDRLFTGDCLLIGGCGDIGGPGGNAVALYDSVTRRLFAFEDETLVYPGHGVAERWVSCIGEERETNPMFHGVSRDRFVAMVTSEHGRPPPVVLPVAIEANRHCGHLLHVARADG